MKAALLLALAAQSIPSSAPPAPASGPRWIAEGGDHFCALSRTSDDQSRLAFAVRLVPGDNRVQLLFVPGNEGQDQLLLDRPAVIALSADNAHFERQTPQRRHRTVGVLLPFVVAGTFDPDFLDRLAGARAIRVTQGRSIDIRIPFSGADRAVDIMRRCIELGAARWRIDLTRLAALSRWPQVQRRWLGIANFPSGTRESHVGRMVLRLSIDAAGRIADCTVVASSDDPVLDTAACQRTGAGRFLPALDAEGHPVAVDIAMPLRWIVLP